MANAASTKSFNDVSTRQTQQPVSSRPHPKSDGNRGKHNGQPPSFPQFNLTESYFMRRRAPGFPESPSIDVCQFAIQPEQASDPVFKALLLDLDRDQEKARLQVNLAAFQQPEFAPSPEVLASLFVLTDPDGAGRQPQSSTSSTSTAAAAAAQQNAAASGCCIPPGCNIV